jgi:hypothetical protein
MMKDKGVCDGCKYHIVKDRSLSRQFDDTCQYLDVEGKSRLMVEMNNGGYRTDSCCCYEAGKTVRRVATALSVQGRR